MINEALGIAWITFILDVFASCLIFVSTLLKVIMMKNFQM